MTLQADRCWTLGILLVVAIVALYALVTDGPSAATTGRVALITCHCGSFLEPALWTLVGAPLSVLAGVIGYNTVGIGLTLDTQLFTWC